MECAEHCVTERSAQKQQHRSACQSSRGFLVNFAVLGVCVRFTRDFQRTNETVRWRDCYVCTKVVVTFWKITDDDSELSAETAVTYD